MSRVVRMSALAVAVLLMSCGEEAANEQQQRGVHTTPGAVKADGTNSCVGNCGGQALSGCWCDPMCKAFNDCCTDYDATCVPNPTQCGPWPGGQCPAEEVCDIQSCGVGAGGTCVHQPKPQECVQWMYLPAQPVCGCDGKTYGSNCDRLAAGTALDHQGDCNTPTPTPTPTPPTPPAKCGAFPGGQCPTGMFCDIQSCGVGATGTCIKQPKAQECVDLMYLPPQPVCGCDGKTYNNDCMRQVAGVALDHQGACAPSPNRTVATGVCVRNSFDACSQDSDCVSGGCGGELCFNPAVSGGASFCDCVQPTGVSCGCVNGKCAWWK